MRVGAVGSALLLVAALFFANTAYAVDELARLNARIIQNPSDIEANLAYAQAAEAQGRYDQALAAYERVLAVEPGNGAALLGQSRAAAHNMANTFELFAEYGPGYETNPHNLSFDKHAEGEFFARALFKDERTIGDTRWRTTGLLTGNIYEDSKDLGYAYGALAMGPVYTLTPNLNVHPSIGGGAAYFDQHFFYSEVFTSTIFEGVYDLTSYTARFRAGYRSYDDFFPSTQGWFADAVLKFSRPDVLSDDDLFIFSPWVRWSGVNTIDNLNTLVSPDDFLTGRYTEPGARVEYYKPIFEWMTGSVNFSYLERFYTSAIDSTGARIDRRDKVYSPGAALIFSNEALGKFGKSGQNSVRLDYRYERDDSNTELGSYTNHIVTLTFFNRY